MPEKIPLQKIRALDICAQIEDACAELYHYFADIYAANPQVQQLWRSTALEEEDHAIQIRFAVRLRSDGIEDVTVDAWLANNELQILRSILESVKKTPPTFVEALRMAIKLEEKLVNFHLGCVASFADQGSSKLFDKMTHNDRAHLERLTKAYELVVKRQQDNALKQ